MTCRVWLVVRLKVVREFPKDSLDQRGPLSERKIAVEDELEILKMGMNDSQADVVRESDEVNFPQGKVFHAGKDFLLRVATVTVCVNVAVERNHSMIRVDTF